MLVADSCAWGKHWLVRAPDYFSNKHSPPSEARLISAGHRGG